MPDVSSTASYRHDTYLGVLLDFCSFVSLFGFESSNGRIDSAWAFLVCR